MSTHQESVQRSLAALQLTDSEEEINEGYDDGVPYWYNVIERLSNVGYHRARVFELPEFNKIVGALRWALFHIGGPDSVGVLFKEFPKRGEGNMNLFKEEAIKVTQAIRAIGCPHTFHTKDILRNRCDKTLNMIEWVTDKIHQLDTEEKQYKKFGSHFDRQFDCPGEASINYEVALHRPALHREYEAEHWKLFDDGILFEKDVPVKIVLAEYMLYTNYNKRHFPPKVIPEVGESEEEVEEKRRAYAVGMAEAIEKLEPLAAKFFAGQTNQEIEKKVIAKMIEEAERIQVGPKLAYYKERLQKNAANYCETLIKMKVLEMQMKNALENAIEFDHEGMDPHVHAIEHLQVKLEMLHTLVQKEHLIVSNKEFELRMNIKDGKLQKYSPKQRELADRQGEKRKKLEELLDETYAAKERVQAVFLNSKGSKQRYIALKREQEVWYEAQNFDTRLAEEFLVGNIRVSLAMVERATANVRAVRKHVGDAGEDHRQTFAAFTSDAHLALYDLFMKAAIQTAKFRELLKIHEKMERCFRKMQEDAILSAQEFDRMFLCTRTIQEYGVKLENLEAQLKEIKTRK